LDKFFLMSLNTLILAGGFAKRFRPLSDYVPKPLFPVGDYL